MSVEEAFRELRAAWFNRVLRSEACEREWESESQEDLREQLNAAMRRAYDADTNAILRGENRAVTPYFMAEVNGGKE